MSRVKLKMIALVIAVLPFLSSCAAGSTNRMDLDAESPFSDTTTSSKDLRTVCEKMARSIIQLPQISNSKSPPRIAFVEVRNRTNEILDKDMFLDKIRTLLLKFSGGKVVFLDRSIAEAIVAEREAKRKDQVTASSKKHISGADYFMTGDLSSIDKASGHKRLTFTRYSFRLVDAETSDIVWEDEYEVRKLGSKSVWDR